jgi:hypothetical protein
VTVSTTSIKNSAAGNGSTTAFSFTFKVFASSEVKVYVRTDSTGAETLKAEGTGSANYSVSGVGSASGGTVTFVTAPASGETVVIRRNTAQTQGTDYVENDPFAAEDHETALDKLTHIVQEVQEQLDRSIKASRTNTISSVEFLDGATARANKLLAFDGSGDLSVTQEIGTFRGNWAASTAYAVRDIVKDTSTNNIFIVTSAHTSSGSQPLTTNSNSSSYSLLVDAASSSTSQTAAASSASASASSATASAASASTSSTKAAESAASASTASGHKDTATTKASEAAASAVTAANEASALAPKYSFSTTTSMADPGAGNLRYNNGTVASVSEIAIDDQTADTGNPDIEAWILTWDDSTSTVKGVLRLVEPGTPANYAVFHVTGLTNGSGFVTLAVTHVDSNGTFGDGDSIRVTFDRNGAKGDTGSTGSTGSTGARGDQPGLRMVFETATADADQGAGKVHLNNGTASSATVLFVDDVEAGGASINSFVDSWDDSTNTALRGTVTIAKTAAPENFHIFNVTGAVTSASTYSKVAVGHVLSSGTISDGDPVNVQFVRTGNAGADGSGSMTSFTMSDGSTTQAVTDGNTMTFAAGEGLDVAVSATDTVTYSGEDASTSNKGVASFSSDNFSVSSGAVTIKDGGVVTAEIADDAVTSAKIADDAVVTAAIADDAITSDLIADDAVLTAAIADDAITTALIADDSITSALIADDAVLTAAIADDAITAALIADDAVGLAAMATATDGVIITYDASGNPVHVGPGTDGQVLTSTGAGSPPAFENAPGGGALTLIGSQDSGGSDSALTQTGLTGFDSFMVVIADFCPQTSSATLQIRVGDSSGIDSGSFDYAFYSYGGMENGTASTLNNQNASAIQATHSTGVGEYVNTVFYVHSAPSGAIQVGVHGQSQALLASGGNVSVVSFAGVRQNTDITLDRVSVHFSSGNITSGSLTVYGFKQS